MVTGFGDLIDEEYAKLHPDRGSAAGASTNANGASTAGHDHQLPGSSVFDRLAELTSWADILEPAGWTQVDPHDAAALEGWRRPGGTHPVSAKILKANQHVLVIHSEDAGLPTGAGQRLTKARVVAHLQYGGDESALGKALARGEAVGVPPHVNDACRAKTQPRTGREAREDYLNAHATQDPELDPYDGYEPARDTPAAEPHEPNESEPEDPEQPEPDIGVDEEAPTSQVEAEDKFWNERPALRHIRDFAYARMCAPAGVLGVTIVRVLHHVPPWVTLPPLIGGHGSLNVFAALVATSGGGKGSVEQSARDAFDLHDEQAYEAPLGSGEGIAHQYAHRERGEIIRDRNAVIFSTAEIDTIAALHSRQGSTLTAQLRTMFSGERLGFGYADQTRRIPLEPHSYRAGLIVGVQPERAAALLDQSDGGTPQRFVWLLCTDPRITADPPPAPKPMRITATRGPWKPGDIRIPDQAAREIREAHAARNRGEGDALDGHALFCREKVAVALALLDDRRDVNLDDWRLAGVVMAMSDATRASVISELQRKARAAETAKALGEGRREVIRSSVTEDHEMQKACQAITRKLDREHDWVSGKAAKDVLGARRHLFEGAVDKLEETGQIEMETVEYRGQPGLRLRLKKGARG